MPTLMTCQYFFIPNGEPSLEPTGCFGKGGDLWMGSAKFGNHSEMLRAAEFQSAAMSELPASARTNPGATSSSRVAADSYVGQECQRFILSAGRGLLLQMSSA